MVVFNDVLRRRRAAALRQLWPELVDAGGGSSVWVRITGRKARKVYLDLIHDDAAGRSSLVANSVAKWKWKRRDIKRGYVECWYSGQPGGDPLPGRPPSRVTISPLARPGDVLTVDPGEVAGISVRV